MKQSSSDRAQEPRGVAGNWEKDNVSGTRIAAGGSIDGIRLAANAQVPGSDVEATEKIIEKNETGTGADDNLSQLKSASMCHDHTSSANT